MKRRLINVKPLKSKDLSESKKIKKVEKLTKWKIYKNHKSENSLKDKRCPICLDDFQEDDRKVVALTCDKKCEFHVECIIKCYNTEKDFIKCPCCMHNFGIEFGPMPHGTMSIEKFKHKQLPLSGYTCGTIQIIYQFPNGIQNRNMEYPGQAYQGTSRTAYLPDNKIGNIVLDKLIIAFERRHSFRVGQSVTTNAPNTTVWNGIHHKTCTSGGFASFGYPDENYFDRVLSELWHKGIK